MERQISRNVRFNAKNIQLKTIQIVFHVIHANAAQKVPITQIEDDIKQGGQINWTKFAEAIIVGGAAGGITAATMLLERKIWHYP